MVLKDTLIVVKNQLMVVIVGGVIASIIWLFSDLPAILIGFLDKQTTVDRTRLIIGLFLSLVLALAWVYVLWRKTKLHPFYGILWDRHLNGFCPSCKKDLSEYSDIGEPGFPKYSFRCVSCEKRILITDDSGKNTDLKTAREFVRTQLGR